MRLVDKIDAEAVAVQKRSHKLEKLARIYDDQIAPVWGARFGKMLLRNLAVPERGQILDISCGTGYPLVEVLRRKGEGARVIAIDASSAMLDVARRKVGSAKGVFFRTESPVPKLSFADDVYDLVMCNLGLAEMPSVKSAINDFARVTKLGGEVRCTLPVEGSWLEFHDIYREVLVKHDKHEALDRLDRHVASYPTVEDCEAWLRAAGLEPRVEIDEFSLLFRSSREFFFAPVVEYGPLAEWKAIAGDGQELQDTFWYIKEAIDAYFGGRAFHVTIKAGMVVGKKLSPEMRALQDGIGDDVSTGRIELLDSAEYPASRQPARMAQGSVRDPGTAELDILEIQEIEGSQEVDYGDIALDAFTDGKARPEHLSRGGGGGGADLELGDDDDLDNAATGDRFERVLGPDGDPRGDDDE